MSLAYPTTRLLTALALSTALAVPAAWAQTSSYDTGSDPVSVDLSVLEGADGAGPATPPGIARSYTYGGTLRLPGPRAPTSELHVEVPGSRASRPAAQVAAPAPAPRPAPRKEVAATPADPPPVATPDPAPTKAVPAPPPATEPAPANGPARLEPAAKPDSQKPAQAEKKQAATQQAPAETEPTPAKAPAKPASPAAAPSSPPPEPAEVAKASPPSAPAAPPEGSAPPPAPEAAPAPEPNAKPAAPEVETASTDATGETDVRSLRLDFGNGETQLPGAATADLSALAERLKANEDLRVQLLAYAGGGDLSASKARRISLSRALSVRSFLIDKGVRSTRIDVRALGDKTDDEPKNRVDVEVVER